MDRLGAKELLPIIEAYANGEDIQFECGDGWADVPEKDGIEASCLESLTYRIKPKPREFKIMVMGDGYVYDTIRQREGFAGELIKVREVLE